MELDSISIWAPQLNNSRIITWHTDSIQGRVGRYLQRNEMIWPASESAGWSPSREFGPWGPDRRCWRNRHRWCRRRRRRRDDVAAGRPPLVTQSTPSDPNNFQDVELGANQSHQLVEPITAITLDISGGAKSLIFAPRSHRLPSFDVRLTTQIRWTAINRLRKTGNLPSIWSATCWADGTLLLHEFQFPDNWSWFTGTLVPNLRQFRNGFLMSSFLYFNRF